MIQKSKLKLSVNKPLMMKSTSTIRKTNEDLNSTKKSTNISNSKVMNTPKTQNNSSLINDKNSKKKIIILRFIHLIIRKINIDKYTKANKNREYFKK